MIDPLQSLFKHSRVKRRRLGEKSIVRPVFSFYGKLTIDDRVVHSIVQRVLGRVNSIKKIKNMNVKHLFKGNEDQGLSISCEVILNYGSHIPTLISQTQSKVREVVEFSTGLAVHSINIVVKALYVDQQLANVT